MTTKRIARYGLLIALALILSYVESLLPVFVAVPGVKMGLPNIVIMFALYSLGVKDAAIISLIRVVLAGALFGSVFSMLYSAAGAVLSLAVMAVLLKTKRFSPVGVSVAGGVAHNAGQIIVAILVTETAQLIYYLPVLCISGIAAGVLIGVVSGIIINRLQKQI
ncbi:MAG: Gx transporter family protein [Firmicutes bacterium]|nr:Gx transporter family protein [Bacillota bacterium]